MRVITAVAVMGALSVANGCGFVRVLGPSDSFDTAGKEGAIAATADADVDVSVLFCADDVHCAAIGPMTRAAPVAVGVVAPGRWCARQWIAQKYGAQIWDPVDIPPAKAPCVDVVAGRIGYGGTLVIGSRAVGNTSFDHYNWRMQRRPDEVRSRVDAQFPYLRGTPIDGAS